MKSPLLWTAAYYGQQQNPRSVTFFNSVIKTPLLRTLLTDFRQLWTPFLVLIEEKPSIVDKKYLFQRKKNNFLTKFSDCSAMMCEANYKKQNKIRGLNRVLKKPRYDLSGVLIIGQQK